MERCFLAPGRGKFARRKVLPVKRGKLAFLAVISYNNG
jgi:hypothetical protein